MKKATLFLLLLTFYLSLSAQHIKYEDFIYDANIQTVLLHGSKGQLESPYLRLGSTEKLKLSFDDMSNESYLFRFTLIHCDHNWRPSDLEQFEYIDGFTEGDITNYAFSFNAIPGYVHYEAIFPRPDMRITLSGNYVLIVYLNDLSEENIILTRRFFVIEPLARIDVAIPYYPKNLEYTRLKQQIDLTIYATDFFNSEPQKRINVNIQQNGRWDNMKTGLKPTTITGQMLNYDYPYGIVFDGGNQFREFNMESYWYRSMYISQILSIPEGYRVVLHTGYSKAKKPYETLADINGKRVIKARKGQVTATEGEYAWVEFWLKVPEFTNADVYILGQLNDWQLDNKSRMQYDKHAHMYFGQLYLKQGYYNYLYAVVPDGEEEGDVTLIEGDHWETANNYTVYVYYRERVPDYDRLVGYLTINSREARR